MIQVVSSSKLVSSYGKGAALSHALFGTTHLSGGHHLHRLGDLGNVGRSSNTHQNYTCRSQLNVRKRGLRTLLFGGHTTRTSDPIQTQLRYAALSRLNILDRVHLARNHRHVGKAKAKNASVFDRSSQSVSGSARAFSSLLLIGLNTLELSNCDDFIG